MEASVHWQPANHRRVERWLLSAAVLAALAAAVFWWSDGGHFVCE